MITVMVIDADYYPSSDDMNIWYMWRDQSPYVLQIPSTGLAFMESLPEEERERFGGDTRNYWKQVHPHERDKTVERFLNALLTQLTPAQSLC